MSDFLGFRANFKIEYSTLSKSASWKIFFFISNSPPPFVIIMWKLFPKRFKNIFLSIQRTLLRADLLCIFILETILSKRGENALYSFTSYKYIEKVTTFWKVYVSKTLKIKLVFATFLPILWMLSSSMVYWSSISLLLHFHNLCGRYLH